MRKEDDSDRTLAGVDYSETSLLTDTIGTTKIVLHMEVSVIQWVNNTVMYYCGTRISVLNIQFFSFIKWFHFMLNLTRQCYNMGLHQSYQELWIPLPMMLQVQILRGERRGTENWRGPLPGTFSLFHPRPCQMNNLNRL